MNVNNTLSDSLSTAALALAEKLNYKNGIGTAKFILGKLNMYSGNYLKSTQFLLDSKKIFEAENNEQRALESYSMLSLSKSKEGKYDESETISKEIVAIANTKGLKEIKNRAIMNLSTNFLEQKNYASALKYALESTIYFEEKGDKRALSTHYNNIGVILKNMENYSEALKYHNNALRLRQEDNFEKGIAMSYSNIGVVYNRMKKYDLALLNYSKALEIQEKLGNKEPLALAYSNVSTTYKETGKNKEALINADKALTLFKDLDNKPGMGRVYRAIAEIYLAMNMLKECEEYVDLAQQIAKSIANKELEFDILQTRRSIAIKKNDDKTALKELEKSIAIKDSLFTIDKAKQIDELLIQYESEKKDKQLLQINAEMNERKLELELKSTKNKLLTMGVVSLFALLVILFAFFYQRKTAIERKHKLDRQLALQAMRMNVAADLHDDVGSTLSSISIYSEAIKNKLNQNETEKVMELVLKIGENARETITNLSDIVWSINPNNDSGEKVFNKMETLALSILASKDIELKFTCDKQLLNLEFSVAIKQNLFLFSKRQ